MPGDSVTATQGAGLLPGPHCTGQPCPTQHSRTQPHRGIGKTRPLLPLCPA